MYNKKTIPLLYTAVFGFILINKPIFADTDAGSLLNRFFLIKLWRFY